jgi:rfaE bifunctional protein kinase chain/domain
LVIGDVMLDEYIFGSVDRISPEAPIPVVNQESRSTLPGGAANVAASLVGLGGEVTLMGLVGDDFAAAELSSILNELSVDLHFTKIVGRPTTHKLRIVAAGQQVVRVDLEDISKPPMTTVNWIGQEVDRLRRGSRFYRHSSSR